MYLPDQIFAVTILLSKNYKEFRNTLYTKKIGGHKIPETLKEAMLSASVIFGIPALLWGLFKVGESRGKNLKAKNRGAEGVLIAIKDAKDGSLFEIERLYRLDAKKASYARSRYQRIKF